MKNTGNEIFRQIGIQDQEMKNWKNLKNYDKIVNSQVIEKGEPIFMRLKVDEEVEFLKNMMKNQSI